MNVYLVRAAFRVKCGKQMAGFVHWKIGRVLNAERRMSVLQAMSPVPVELIGLLPCESKSRAIAVESELKEYFADAAVAGWLSLTPRQTAAVHALIKCWPQVSSVTEFLNSLPKRIDCDADLLRVGTEYVRHAALHEARLQIKQLRNEVAEANRLVQKSALTYKQMFDSAIEVLTQKYNQAIQALQFRALH